MRAVNIRTEYMHNPVGIDIRKPRISWSCDKGVKQTAYEVSARADDTEFWNSGKVVSSDMSAFIGREAESRERIHYRIRLWDENDVCGEWSEQAYYEEGLLEQSDFAAKWINPEQECDVNVHKPASYLRTSFNAHKGREARLYITCHGLYEAYINGKRVGDFVLAPGSYNYDRQLAYQTYDVSELLVEGKNEVLVILGDGWYRSTSGVDGNRNIYGTDVALYFQLETDGKVVCISDEKWEASQSGPIRENDMQQGELVDARMENITDFHGVKVENFGTDKLICSNAPKIKEKERFKGKLIKTPDGSRVIDFGQNLAGYIEFDLKAHEGDRLILTHGETLDENGNFTQENFQDRKRHKEGGTNQRVTYICKEGENHYKSVFTIWGFRYALLDTQADIEDALFTAIAVYSDMEETASFDCSDAGLNKLFSNCMWSMKSNFCDVPTDCPTRERAAWTGDMGVFINTGLYLMDCYGIVRKWLTECRLAQYEDGRISNIAPRNNNPSFFSGLLAGSVGWGDACIIVPYAMYRRMGDERILSDNYEMMKSWYEYLRGRAKKKPLNPLKRLKKMDYRDYIIETGIDYGEWCEPDVENTNAMRTPQGKIATAYLAYSGRLLSEIADILGKKEDSLLYAECARLAKKGFREIATNNGDIESERQADYIRAITFDLLDGVEKNNAAEKLDSLVIANDYHLNTGFLSTPDLCYTLAEYGYTDTAYNVLLQKTMPGWLYQVERGATTIWEAWNGIDGNGKPSESLNHYSKGAIAGWLMEGVCGIRVRGDGIIIVPKPDRRLRYAKASYDSPYGRITSGFRYEEDKLILEVELPANVSARLIMPDGTEKVISGHCLYEV